MLLIACSNDNDPVNDDDDEEIVIDEDFATNTKDTTFVDVVTIAYTDNIVTITNPYANEGVSITQRVVLSKFIAITSSGWDSMESV